MAVRGQRFQIDLDSDDETNTPKPIQQADRRSPFLNLVGDIKERDTPSQVKAPSPPKLKSTATGFPTHKKVTRPSTFKQRRTHEVTLNGENTTQTVLSSLPGQSHSDCGEDGPDLGLDLGDSLDNELERQRIHEENEQRLAHMSAEDIEEAREELVNGLSPSLIERLLKKANIDDEPRELRKVPQDILQEKMAKPRANLPQKRVTFEESTSIPTTTPHPPSASQNAGSPGSLSQDIRAPQNSQAPQIDPSSPNFLSELHDKYFPELPSDPSTLSWMQPLPEKSSYDPAAESLPAAALRFDFRGRLLPPRLSSQLPSTLGLHHHSSAPSSAGYTIPELAHLARSTFPTQRCLAMQTLGRILYRLGRRDFGIEGDDLSEGLWLEVEKGRVIDNLVEAAAGDSDKGNRTTWVTATEAVWLWRKGGGRRWKGR